MTLNRRFWMAILLLNLLTGYSARANPENTGVGNIALAKAVVRSAPAYLAKPSFELNYGARVIILERRNDWVRIRAQEKSGWLPKAALEVSDNALQDAGMGAPTNNSIYDNEIVTAGKGFSPEYENMLKSQNRNWNYQDVDALDQKGFSEKQLFDFARAVKLESEVFN